MQISGLRFVNVSCQLEYNSDSWASLEGILTATADIKVAVNLRDSFRRQCQ